MARYMERWMDGWVGILVGGWMFFFLKVFTHVRTRTELQVCRRGVTLITDKSRQEPTRGILYIYSLICSLKNCFIGSKIKNKTLKQIYQIIDRINSDSILSTTVKKKIRTVVHRQEAFDSIYWKYKWWKFSLSYHFVS